MDGLPFVFVMLTIGISVDGAAAEEMITVKCKLSYAKVENIIPDDSISSDGSSTIHADVDGC